MSLHKSIAWVVPPLSTKCSGGQKTIYDHIISISDLYNQTIYMGDYNNKEYTNTQARNIIVDNYETPYH